MSNNIATEVARINAERNMSNNVRATTVEKTDGVDYFIEEFGRCWGSAEDNVRKAAICFASAVGLIGFKDAVKVFGDRYPQFGTYNWQLLMEIGSGVTDVRVFALPRYMHGIRKMDMVRQQDLFNTKRVSIYKFASEKPATIDIGQVNQSDWRVAFDKEKNRLRTSKEQLVYIHEKKKSFADKMRFVRIHDGVVCFLHGGSWTKKELQDLLKRM